jgi:hypothetical protein
LCRYITVLQDLATARVPLSKDAETVALAACESVLAQVKVGLYKLTYFIGASLISECASGFNP